MAPIINTTFDDVPPQTAQQSEVVVTVSDFTSRLQRLLETAVPMMWIQGEISNFTAASSGHWYFQIKDEHAQMSCVMFRFKNQKIDWLPKNGMSVELRGTTSYYAPGGKTQITIENMRQAGLGKLYEAFNALKNKLEKEGLFDRSIKKSLPSHPKSIGIITSPMAAALQDVLTTLKRRAPDIPIIIYPTRVQGQGAAGEIAEAINVANNRDECDVVILCRGGGSIEDLWAYNEETVARAIAHSQLPIISGVGHETDFTIADFVADYRAPTPTAAAELVSPDRPQLSKQLTQIQLRLNQQIQRIVEREIMRFDQLRDKLPTTLKMWLKQQVIFLSSLQQRFVHPGQRINHQKNHIHQIDIRLNLAQQRLLERYQIKLKNLEQSLYYLNPQNIMARGFAIVRNQNGHILSRAGDTHVNESLSIQFNQGELNVLVTDIKQNIKSDE
ncbi:MAG: exodeoxyribonuclease VII large subunit [Betaproteobacteria bacterium]|nr:exodeoxyribonuclease VII large subunit [Betaproteobacteria bacterium]